MLGYVQAYKPDLKMREYEIYKGYYCGVCKYIGQTYGQLPRISLSYDAAFLALLLASTDESPDAVSYEHCVVHHIEKRPVIRNEAVEYAGDVMLILAWHKLRDDAADDGSIKAKALMSLVRRHYRKLEKRYPGLCAEIEARLDSLSRLEKQHCASLDQAAEDFAMIMRAIFGEYHQMFANLGYHIGKWIYLMDAVDDIAENIEKGSYNPLLYRYEYNGEGPLEFKARIHDQIQFNLYHYLAVASQELDTLDIRKNKEIIENIVYFGLNRKTEEILQIENKETDNESI